MCFHIFLVMFLSNNFRCEYFKHAAAGQGKQGTRLVAAVIAVKTVLALDTALAVSFQRFFGTAMGANRSKGRV